MHISLDCATQQHHLCDGKRRVRRDSLARHVCECLCHGHTVSHGTAVPSQVPCDWEIVTVDRQAEQLLTGQEA